MSVTQIGLSFRGKDALGALLSGIFLERQGKVYRFNKLKSVVEYAMERELRTAIDSSVWKPTAWKMNRFLEETFDSWCRYQKGDKVVILDGDKEIIRTVERVTFEVIYGGYNIYAMSPSGSEVRWNMNEIQRKANENDIKALEYVEKLERIFSNYGRELYEWKNGDIVIDMRDNKTYKVESDEKCPEGFAPVTEFGVENASVIYLTDSVLKPVYMVDNMIL